MTDKDDDSVVGGLLVFGCGCCVSIAASEQVCSPLRPNLTEAYSCENHSYEGPVCSVGSRIQGLLSRLSGDEDRWSEVYVARQCRQRAERNTTVNTTMSHLRPGEVFSDRPVQVNNIKVFYLLFKRDPGLLCFA